MCLVWVVLLISSSQNCSSIAKIVHRLFILREECSHFASGLIAELICDGGLVAGLLLGGQEGRGWRVLSGVAAGLLLQHGLLEHGPLAELARTWGVRTRREIDLGKFVLKALRGDFERIPQEGGPLARANAALVSAQS